MNIRSNNRQKPAEKLKTGCRRLVCLFLALLFAGMISAAGCCEGGREPLNASGVPNRPAAVDFSGQNEGYSAVLYNNMNGLPTSEANAIAETS